MGTVGEPGVYLHLDLSPDDTRVAVSRQTQETGQPLQMDIWTIDTQAWRRRQSRDRGPGLSRPIPPGPVTDDSWRSTLAGRRWGLFVRPSDGSGKDVRLVEPVQVIASPDWSVDNKHIVYMDGGDLWTLPMTGDRKPSVFVNTAATEKQPVFSTRRPVGRLYLGQIRPRRSVRAGLPARSNGPPGFARRRLDAAVARRRKGALLSQPGRAR